jgi:hypothetical protein
MKHQKLSSLLKWTENLNPRTIASLIFLVLSLLVIAWRFPCHQNAPGQTTPEITTATIQSNSAVETNLTETPAAQIQTISPETSVQVAETPTVTTTRIFEPIRNEDLDGLNGIIIGCTVLVLIILGGTIYGIKAKQDR